MLATLKSKATELVVTAVLAVAVAAFWGSWSEIKDWAKGFVIETVSSELMCNNDNKDKTNKCTNRLLRPIGNTLQQLRSTDIGALSAGTFTLTLTQSQYVLPIYRPATSLSAKLIVTFDTRDLSDEYYILLQTDNGAKWKYVKSDNIDLGKMLDQKPKEDDFTDHPGYSKGLHQLTFTLQRRESDHAAAGGGTAPDSNLVKTSPKVMVSYLALISPTIKMEGKP